MSYTRSRGLVTAAHYSTIAITVYFVIHSILKKGRCTGREIPKGLRQAFNRFFEAAFNGMEIEGGGTPRKDIGTTKSLMTLQVARRAATVKVLGGHALPDFLVETQQAIQRLQRPHTLTTDEKEELLSATVFLRAIADAGEQERETHRVLYDDDD